MLLPVHPGLSDGSRLGIPATQHQRHQTAELMLLVGAGVCAALATAFLDTSLRIPGHAIVRAVFPMSLGLALAPRRMGGMLMGTSALGTVLVIKTGGFGAVGMGAMTSLAMTGPMLDLALWRARRGWTLYAGFALAGIGANLAAFTVRALPKLVGFDHALGRPVAMWWPQAIATYTVFGLLAGLISALVWFKFAAGRRGDSLESAP
jgi:hypothetical protein